MMRRAKGAVEYAAPEKRVEWALRSGLRAVVNSMGAPAAYDTGVRPADVLYNGPTRLDVIFVVWV
jgi:hypothetical protein